MRRARAIAGLACAAALAGACGDSGSHQSTPRAARPVSTSICGPVTYGGKGRHVGRHAAPPQRSVTGGTRELHEVVRACGDVRIDPGPRRGHRARAVTRPGADTDREPEDRENDPDCNGSAHPPQLCGRRSDSARGADPRSN